MYPFKLVPMTERHAAAIASWRYPQPYERYNSEPWERLSVEGIGMADPVIREKQFRSVLRHGDLCGFAQWFPLYAEHTQDAAPSIIRLGVGLRPDLCGRGLGADFVAFIAEETAKQHPGAAIDLEVAADNLRAIRAYERAGFRKTDEYIAAGEAIICMVWH